MVTTPKPDLASLRIHDTKRTSTGSGKRWLWIVLALILLVLVAAAASAFLNRKTEVQVASSMKPATGPTGVLNASGYITPRRRATIAAIEIRSLSFSPSSILSTGTPVQRDTTCAI